MSRVHLVQIGLALLIAFGMPASVKASGVAQPVPGQPDPFNGKALAEKLCTNCHLVSAGQTQAPADVPSFVEIAKRPGQSAQRITTQIMLPPHPMPEIPLARDELADLAAYILALRSAD